MNFLILLVALSLPAQTWADMLTRVAKSHSAPALPSSPASAEAVGTMTVPTVPLHRCGCKPSETAPDCTCRKAIVETLAGQNHTPVTAVPPKPTTKPAQTVAPPARYERADKFGQRWHGSQRDVDAIVSQRNALYDQGQPVPATSYAPMYSTCPPGTSN